jgi:hypothetical protein
MVVHFMVICPLLQAVLLDFENALNFSQKVAIIEKPQSLLLWISTSGSEAHSEWVADQYL